MIYQTQSYIKKLTNGEAYDIKFSDLDDVNFNYSVHTVVILGNEKQRCVIELNGIQIKLSSGFVYNYTPIVKLRVIDAPFGILIIGNKTRKTLGDTNIFDDTFNLYGQSSYVPEYFQ
jgi:hypothetical protein